MINNPNPPPIFLMTFSPKNKFILKIYPLHSNQNYCLSILQQTNCPVVCKSCTILFIPAVTCKLKLENSIWTIMCIKCNLKDSYYEPIKEESSSEFEVFL
ncbi:hypothetical protein NBO_54g0018 [Nosema bombycis CQ1]|uniref:Uncharacterized protein n=1 Tax=Nosema bombycis (strain CQ1 / CVCC 102059) TaxID=578461 RepID=R0KUK0_NOSB1|nr:hypothetical protein NBO_54g0018 [Nosema bombycis CQ1]|eukprot:EOB13872.1 hypothetical protein NBO_54g0018 [Nosema bombycis CQ1]